MNSLDDRSKYLPGLADNSREQYTSEPHLTSPDKFTDSKGPNGTLASQNQNMNNENKNNKFETQNPQGEQDNTTNYQPSTMTYSSKLKSSQDSSLNFKNRTLKDFAPESSLGTNFLSPDETQQLNGMTIEEVERKVDENLRKIDDLEHVLNSQLNKLTSTRDTSNNALTSARGLASPDKSTGNNTARLRSPVLASSSVLKKQHVSNSPSISRAKENYLGLKTDLLSPTTQTAGPNLAEKTRSIGDRFDFNAIDLRRAYQEGVFRRPLHSHNEPFRSPDRAHSYKSSYDQMLSPNPYSSITSPTKYGGLYSDRFSQERPGAKSMTPWGASSQDPSGFFQPYKPRGSNFEDILESTRKLIHDIKAGPVSQRSSQVISARNSNQPKPKIMKKDAHYSISQAQKSPGTDLTYSSNTELPSKTKSILEESKKLFSEIKDTFRSPSRGPQGSEDVAYQPTNLNTTNLPANSYASPKGNAGQFNFDQSRSPQSMQYTKSPEPNPKLKFDYNDPLRNTVSTVQQMASPGLFSSVDSDPNFRKMAQGPNQLSQKNTPNEMMSSTEQNSWQPEPQGRSHGMDKYYFPQGLSPEEERIKKSHFHNFDQGRQPTSENRQSNYDTDRVPRSEALYKLNPYEAADKSKDDTKPEEDLTDRSKSQPSSIRPYRQAESMYQFPEGAPTDRESQPQNISHVREKLSPANFQEDQSGDELAEEYQDHLKKLIAEVEGSNVEVPHPFDDFPPKKNRGYEEPQETISRDEPAGLLEAPQDRPIAKSSRSHSRPGNYQEDYDDYPEIPMVDEHGNIIEDSSQPYESEEEHFVSETRPRKIYNRLPEEEKRDLVPKAKQMTPERHYFTGELEPDVDSAVKPTTQKAKKTTKKNPLPPQETKVTVDLGLPKAEGEQPLKKSPVKRDKEEAPKKESPNKIENIPRKETSTKNEDLPRKEEPTKKKKTVKRKESNELSEKRTVSVSLTDVSDSGIIENLSPNVGSNKLNTGNTSPEVDSMPTQKLQTQAVGTFTSSKQGSDKKDPGSDKKASGSDKKSPVSDKKSGPFNPYTAHEQKPTTSDQKSAPSNPYAAYNQKTSAPEQKLAPGEKKSAPEKGAKSQAQPDKSKPLLKQESFSNSYALPQHTPIRTSEENPLKTGMIKTAEFGVPILENIANVTPGKLSNPAGEQLTPQVSQIKLQLVSQPVKKPQQKKPANKPAASGITTKKK